MFTKIRISLPLLALGGLAACGDTVAEQAIVAGGAGAAAAIALDGRPFTGAVLGAAGNLVYCQSSPASCT